MRFIPLTMIYEKEQADEENEGRLERLSVVRADMITRYEEAWGIDAKKRGIASYVFISDERHRVNVREDVATIWVMMNDWSDATILGQIQDGRLKS